jgi:hypothetical protein
MKEEYSALLRKLEIKYSSKKYGEYKDGGLYGNLLNYRFDKDQLSIVLYPDGKPEEHTELIKSVISDLIKILPKNYTYKLSICGWYSYVKNGDLNVNFTDGNYYIEEKHQEMHDRKEVATIMDVANLNKIAYTEFKWNILKKKSIELDFVPVKDKSGHENLYLVEAFKICYPEYNYIFGIENELPKDLSIEPKRKKFLGLF